MIQCIKFLTAVFILMIGINTAHATTLSEIQKRGVLNCGVSNEMMGFSTVDGKGNWRGLDVDMCRVLAAAVLGSSQKVHFIPLTLENRFTALKSGTIDVLSRNTTWTESRDSALGLDFTAIVFYDGQTFMVPKKLKVILAHDLDDKTICTVKKSTSEQNATDYFRTHNMKHTLLTYNTYSEVLSAYESGRCDAFTADSSVLAAQKIKLKNPNGHIILSEMISKEPLSPSVRQGDDDWNNVVRWIIWAIIEAEELGVTSVNVPSMQHTSNPAIRRLLGVEGTLGQNVGLNNNWIKIAVLEVGNYGEIYERNFGNQSALKLPRGLNKLWNKGGLMYAPPLR